MIVLQIRLETGAASSMAHRLLGSTIKAQKPSSQPQPRRHSFHERVFARGRELFRSATSTSTTGDDNGGDDNGEDDSGGAGPSDSCDGHARRSGYEYWGLTLRCSSEQELAAWVFAIRGRLYS
jgi:hypothetical protein